MRMKRLWPSESPIFFRSEKGKDMIDINNHIADRGLKPPEYIEKLGKIAEYPATYLHFIE